MDEPLLYLRFLVEGVLPVPPAVLLELKLTLHVLAVLRCSVVAPIALSALQRDQLKVLRLALCHADVSCLPDGTETPPPDPDVG